MRELPRNNNKKKNSGMRGLRKLACMSLVFGWI